MLERARRPSGSRRAERADARSVKQPARLQRRCTGRRSGAALRLRLRARPPSDPPLGGSAPDVVRGVSLSCRPTAEERADLQIHIPWDANAHDMTAAFAANLQRDFFLRLNSCIVARDSSAVRGLAAGPAARAPPMVPYSAISRLYQLLLIGTAMPFRRPQRCADSLPAARNPAIGDDDGRIGSSLFDRGRPRAGLASA
jgi:hypothetical protein